MVGVLLVSSIRICLFFLVVVLSFVSPHVLVFIVWYCRFYYIPSGILLYLPLFAWGLCCLRLK